MKSEKLRYDKEDDVLMVWFSREPVDYAEQEENLIVHFSKEHKPVLMEILDASAFLKETAKTLPPDIRQQIFMESSS